MGGMVVDLSPGRSWERIRPYELDPVEAIGLEVLGDLVHRVRRLNGLSQRSLGALCGVHQSTISRLERGRLRCLRLRTLARILGVLHDPLQGRAPTRLTRWS
jgi:DNA-binding XRE family transcriptional regulator